MPREGPIPVLKEPSSVPRGVPRQAPDRPLCDSVCLSRIAATNVSVRTSKLSAVSTGERSKPRIIALKIVGRNDSRSSCIPHARLVPGPAKGVPTANRSTVPARRRPLASSAVKAGFIRWLLTGEQVGWTIRTGACRPGAPMWTRVSPPANVATSTKSESVPLAAHHPPC